MESYHTPAVMKKLTITLLLLITLGSIAFAWISFTGTGKNDTTGTTVKNKVKPSLSVSTIRKFRIKANEAKNYAIANGYNSSFCFLIDMSMASGMDRFIVYDLEKDSIKKRGLVTHGRCNEDWLEGRRYGNTVGCGCTSLGKYKIGHSYMGRFGLAFKLYGLEKTNDKAYQRFVVLHSHECVPETEVSNDI